MLAFQGLASITIQEGFEEDGRWLAPRPCLTADELELLLNPRSWYDGWPRKPLLPCVKLMGVRGISKVEVQQLARKHRPDLPRVEICPWPEWVF